MIITKKGTVFIKNRFYTLLTTALGVMLLSSTYADTIVYPGQTPSNPGVPPVADSIYPTIPSGNSVTINNGGATILGSVFGGIGQATGIMSTGNIVTMNGGRVNTNVTGGWSLDGNSMNNQVTLISGRVDNIVFGGWVDQGTGAGNQNHVTIASGMTLGSNVYGSYVQGTGGADGNSITINGDALLNSTSIIAGGYSLSTGTVQNNTVTIMGGRMNNANVYGGRANTSADVLNNTTIIHGGTIGGNVFGGQLINGNKLISGNQLIISGGTIAGDALGGAIGGGAGSTGNVTNNSVTISGGIVNGNIYGGKASTIANAGNATGNIVTISGTPSFAAATEIYGGFSGNTAADVFTGNTFNIQTNHIEAATVSNFANYNFTLQPGLNNNDTVLQLAQTADLTNATINATLAEVPHGMEVGDTIQLIATTDAGGLTTTGLTNAAGGSIGTSSATGLWTYDSYVDTQEVGLFFNTLTIDQLTKVSPYSIVAGTLANQYVGLTVLGDFTVPDFTMTSNAMNAATLKVHGTLNTSSFSANAGAAGLSAEVGKLDVTNNDVVLNLNNTVGWDGFTGVLFDTVTLDNGRSLTLNGNGTFRLNTLNVMSNKTAYIGHLPATNAQLNFYLPSALGNGQTMLNLTGTADISGSNVAIGIPSGITDLVPGDKIILIETTGGITATGINTKASTIMGVARIYDFDITTDATNLYASIPATPTDPTQPTLPYRLNPGLVALSEGQAAGLANLNYGGDFVMSQGMNSLLGITEKGDVGPFIALGGSALKYKLKGDMKVDSFNVLMGFGWQPKTLDNRLLLGAFLEGGWGDYDTENVFSNHITVKGGGDTNYWGGGLMVRHEWTTGVAKGIYLEGVIRGGRVKTDFFTSNIGFGKHAKYESSAGYYGTQVGGGYVWDLSDRSQFDLSAYYLWTHQEGDSVLIDGDTIDFKAADSHRIRLSGRYHYKVNNQFIPYAGIGYEYEADGKIKASTHHMKIDELSLKGSSGILEAGFNFAPSERLPLQIEADIRGYIGKRKGVTGNLRFKYVF